MDLHEAITEARENIVGHTTTEPCVVSALLSEIDRQSAEICRMLSGTLHSQYEKSLRPRCVWKRRKNQLKQIAFKDCPDCKGRGLIVDVPSSGIKGVECLCTKGKQLQPNAPC